MLSLEFSEVFKNIGFPEQLPTLTYASAVGYCLQNSYNSQSLHWPRTSLATISSLVIPKKYLENHSRWLSKTYLGPC